MIAEDVEVGPFYRGDEPREPLVLTFDEGQLDGYDQAEARLYDPEGDLVAGGLTAAIDGDEVTIQWPNASPFAGAGIHVLSVVVYHTAPAGRRAQIEPVLIVVQAVNDGWHTLQSARDEWADAPRRDVTLWALLDSCRRDVEEYGPAYIGRPPGNYKLAQLMQARNRWNASSVNGDGELGAGEFVYRPHPLDWAVKQLIRPKRARPVIA